MTEEWRPVVGHEAFYDVSSMGRVRSWKDNRRPTRAAAPRVLKPYLAGRYPIVGLHEGNVRFARTVHSLVAEAFLGPRPEGMEVRHLNGDHFDPRLANLRYGTQAQNQADRVLHGTDSRGERHGQSKLTLREVLEIRSSTEPQAVLALRYGVSGSCISAIRTRRSWGWAS